MPILLIAELVPETGGEAALQSAVETLTYHSRQEPGCTTYRPLNDPENPGSIVIYEVWNSAKDLEAHNQSDHIAAFKAAVTGLTVTIDRFEI